MKKLLTIVCPTWNNPEYLNPCIDSIVQSGVLQTMAELLIVNNGKQPVGDYVKNIPNIRVLTPGTNLGWERGLQYGLDHSDSEFVCFQNDDTYIPRANRDFYQQLLYPFANANVGAVGPATTVASGWHSIFKKDPLQAVTEVSYLIFFTVMMKRKDLEAVGGIDLECPGGDDFDLSIRLRKMGKKLLVTPQAFIIHHGFKTGTRVRGDHTVYNGWNSKEMTETTNHYLIRKHGFKTYLQTIWGLEPVHGGTSPDLEGALVTRYVKGDKILDLGCGARKTVPNAVGVDRTPQGHEGTHIVGKCIADVEADITQPLPFDDESQDTIIARHVLEHVVNSVETLKNWARALKVNGTLIIAVPNQDICNSIPLNPEHVGAYTPDSLKSLVELIGFEQVETLDPKNGVSFVSVFKKLEPAKELVNA